MCGAVYTQTGTRVYAARSGRRGRAGARGGEPSFRIFFTIMHCMQIAPPGSGKTPLCKRLTGGLYACIGDVREKVFVKKNSV